MLAGRARGMLLGMQQSNATAASSATTSFAGLLAALAAPSEKFGVASERSLPPGWSTSASKGEDGLEDDIATLSYERALRAHSRYRNPEQPLGRNSELGKIGLPERGQGRVPPAASSPPATRATALREPTAIAGSAVISEPETKPLRSTTYERNLKSASITIRLSKVECAQLHRRAADAGLTVSAYLRSCTFEAESLRAMVKDTMAQLRTAKAQARPAEPDLEPEPARRSRPGRFARWLARLLMPWHGGQRVARA